MNLNDWVSETYGGLFCIPILALGAMLIIDLLGGLAIFVGWLLGI